MDVFIGILLFILSGKFIYNLAASTGYKKRYFRLPSIPVTAIPQRAEYVFTPGIRELVNRFIWSVMALIVLFFIGYGNGATATFILMLFFGMPFIIRIVSRLMHCTDRFTVRAGQVEWRTLNNRETVSLEHVKRIYLRYYIIKTPSGKSTYPEFIFKTDESEKILRLYEDFFLDKAEQILVTLQKVVPIADFFIVWEEISGQREEMSVQP